MPIFDLEVREACSAAEGWSTRLCSAPTLPISSLPKNMGDPGTECLGSRRVVFPPPAERQDVHTFLLENLTNGGILELMMRYLKAMGHKFLLRWPPGLAEVMLSIYHSWRRHSTSLPNPLLRDCSNKHIKVGGGGRGGARGWADAASSLFSCIDFWAWDVGPWESEGGKHGTGFVPGGPCC